MSVEIMFDDLKEVKQRELLETVGIKDAAEMNWDILPVAILETTSDKP